MTLSALSGLGAGCEASPGMALPAPRPGAAAITIVTHPAGAAVTVNGVPVGMGPVTVQLNPGPARVRATMSGYYPAQELSIVVERDAHATHELHLVASH
jgi:hypothetical protein